MSQLLEQKPVTFMDRRQADDGHPEGRERRQFRESLSLLNPDAQELAEAIDQFKLLHRRCFIPYEERYLSRTRAIARCWASCDSCGMAI